MKTSLLYIFRQCPVRASSKKASVKDKFSPQKAFFKPQQVPKKQTSCSSPMLDLEQLVLLNRVILFTFG